MRIPETVTVLAQYGPTWACWRMLYEVLVRSGRLQAQFPAGGNAADRLARRMGIASPRLEELLRKGWERQRGTFFVPVELSELRDVIGAPAAAVRRAERIREG